MLELYTLSVAYAKRAYARPVLILWVPAHFAGNLFAQIVRDTRGSIEGVHIVNGTDGEPS
jgi:hypothetical protein